MSKFKVGDKVQSSRPDWTNGLTGEVVFAYDIDSTVDVCFGDDYKTQGWYHKDLPGCWCVEDYELELVTEATPETPKASSKFYVIELDEVEVSGVFETLEEAEEWARKSCRYESGSRFSVLQGLKAFERISEIKEFPVA
jgi:hypothetical protein